jgi:hypothetical protein
MLVNVMPREKSIRSGWRYDSCGELMADLQAGWVEWLVAEDAKVKSKLSGLRLKHRRNPSECKFRATKQCMNWFTMPLAEA